MPTLSRLMGELDTCKASQSTAIGKDSLSVPACLRLSGIVMLKLSSWSTRLSYFVSPRNTPVLIYTRQSADMPYCR